MECIKECFIHRKVNSLFPKYTPQSPRKNQNDLAKQNKRIKQSTFGSTFLIPFYFNFQYYWKSLLQEKIGNWDHKMEVKGVQA